MKRNKLRVRIKKINRASLKISLKKSYSPSVTNNQKIVNFLIRPSQKMRRNRLAFQETHLINTNKNNKEKMNKNVFKTS